MKMKMLHGGDVISYRQKHGQLPLDFSANINPLGLPPGVGEAVTTALLETVHYPDPLCRELSAAIATQAGVEPEQVLCGNGAADLIFRLVWAIKPKRALVVAPTFAEYELALHSAGCAVERHYLTEPAGFALNESILPCLQPGLELLFLCNPNNPTGLLIAPELLQRILARCAELGIVLALDECFIGLTDEPQNNSLCSALASNPNLLILDAFTKLYALPGLRLGYALCANTALLSAMRGAGQPWAVSNLAQAAGLAALKSEDYLRQTRELISAERAYLAAGLQKARFMVWDGAANFLFFYNEKYREKPLSLPGILLRDCANFPGLGPGYYRVAVRTHEENIRLLEALRWAD